MSVSVAASVLSVPANTIKGELNSITSSSFDNDLISDETKASIDGGTSVAVDVVMLGRDITQAKKLPQTAMSADRQAASALTTVADKSQTLVQPMKSSVYRKAIATFTTSQKKLIEATKELSELKKSSVQSMSEAGKKMWEAFTTPATNSTAQGK